MSIGLMEIVDYLFAQIQEKGEAAKPPGGAPAGTGRAAPPAEATGRESSNFSPSGHGLTPETVVDLISQDMLSEEDMNIYCPVSVIKRPDIIAHRLMVIPEPGFQPLVLTVYYHPDSLLFDSPPRYVVDKDVWVRNYGQHWTLISVVVGGVDEALNFIKTFIKRLGLLPSFEVSKDGRRIQVVRLKVH